MVSQAKKSVFVWYEMPCMTDSKVTVIFWGGRWKLMPYPYFSSIEKDLVIVGLMQWVRLNQSILEKLKSNPLSL